MGCQNLKDFRDVDLLLYTDFANDFSRALWCARVGWFAVCCEAGCCDVEGVGDWGVGGGCLGTLRVGSGLKVGTV